MLERAGVPGGGAPELARLVERLEQIMNLLEEAVAAIRSVGADLRRIRGGGGTRGKPTSGTRGAPKLELSAARNLSEDLYVLWRDGRRAEVLEKLKSMSVLNLKSLCKVMNLGMDRRSTKLSLIDSILKVFSERVVLSSNVIVEEREGRRRSHQTSKVRGTSTSGR